MLRLIHTQTVSGAHLVDDINDGLPNKTAHRLGSTGDPKAYAHDGYANAPKQKCYVPRVKAGDVTVAGYIDLNETARVIRSAANGKIAGLAASGKITVVSLVAADLATPVITTAQIGVPGAGALTITGTGLASVAPDITRVVLTGSGAITLTQAQIVTGGGTVSNTSIVIPSSLIPGIAATTTSARVTADGKNSNVTVVTV